MKTTEAQIRRNYAHQPPVSDAHAALHELVRGVLCDAALALNDVVPEGRHKSLMLTALEQARVWGNTAVALDYPGHGGVVSDPRDQSVGVPSSAAGTAAPRPCPTSAPPTPDTQRD